MEIIKNNIEGIFKSKKIRKREINGEVFYVVEDVIEFIIQSKNSHSYLKSLKNRNLELKKGWVKKFFFETISKPPLNQKFCGVQIVTPPFFETKRGKQEINCTNLDGIFKLIEFIPSSKIEEFKRHLYEIGLLKIKEIGE